MSGIRHGASDWGLKRPLGPLTPMTEHDNKKDKPCRKEVGVFIWHLQLKRDFREIIASVRSFQEGAKKKKKKCFSVVMLNRSMHSSQSENLVSFKWGLRLWLQDRLAPMGIFWKSLGMDLLYP